MTNQQTGEHGGEIWQQRSLIECLRRATQWATLSPADVLRWLKNDLEADQVLVLEEIDNRILRCIFAEPERRVAPLLPLDDALRGSVKAEGVCFVEDYASHPTASRLLTPWGAASIAYAPMMKEGFAGALLCGWSKPKAASAVDMPLIRAAAGYFETVSKQHLTTRQLATTEARLSSILATLPQAVIFADFETNDAWLNGPAVALLEMSANNCPVAALAERMSRMQRQFHLEWDIEPGDELLTGVSPSTAWDPAEKPRVLKIVTRNLSLHDRAGRMWLIEDVTAEHQRLRHSERALLESEDRWQFALEGAGDGVWEWDVVSGKLSVTRQWRRIFDYDDEEVCRSVQEFTEEIHPDDRAGFSSMLQQHLAGETPVFVMEFRARTQSGAYKWVLGRGRVTLRDASGNALRMVGTTTDLSGMKAAEEERKGLYAQFLQAQKMESLGRLAGGVAHDFNNLLTVINGFSALMTQKLPRESPIREYAEQIHEAGHRAAGLVNQLLAFSRKKEVARQPVNLTGVVQAMARTALHLVGDDVRIVTDLDPHLPPVMLDPSQAEQLLMNLVVNARDAMPNGGTLTIRTYSGSTQHTCALCKSETQLGHWAAMSVRDNGMGIEPEIMQHLFEPFYTTKEQGRGTGLGLSVVHGIVKNSGGHLTLNSKVGEGTEFCVYFPVVEAEEQLSGPVQAKASNGKATVLLVDDDSAVRRYGADVLEQYGYRVLEAGSAEQALELLNQQPVDLLVTDVMMPETNGCELVATARVSHPGLRALLMSGYAEGVVSFERSPTDDPYIQKPFLPDALAGKVAEVLSR